MLPVQESPSSTRARTGRRPLRTSADATAPHAAGATVAAQREAHLSRCLADFVDSGSSVPRFLIRRPRSALGILRDIRALPRLRADLRPSREATAVRDQMMRNRTSRRFTSGISAVLQIPSTPGTYLDGHERATVRRKIRSAVKSGVTVRPVPAAARAALLRMADQHELHNERTEYRVQDPQNQDLLAYDTWFAAYDGDGEAIALAVTPVAGEWATLRYFRTLHAGDASSDARYLMTQAVAEALCLLGVRHLVDTARPHWLPNGLRHFQRMVGFRLVRVGPARITG